MPQNNKKNNQNQFGGMLVYILIGVVLFGMLLYTFSRGSNMSSSIGTKGNAKTQAIEIIEYAKSIRLGVDKLLQKGCSENEISFENSVVTGYANANSPSGGDKHCWVFDPAGANVKMIKPNTAWLDTAQSAGANYGNWYFTARTCIPDFGTGTTINCNITASAADIILVLPFIKHDLCVEIDKQLINTTTIPSDGDGAWVTSSKYTGTAIGAPGLVMNNLRAQAQCITGTSGTANTAPTTGTYHFYMGLVAR